MPPPGNTTASGVKAMVEARRSMKTSTGAASHGLLDGRSPRQRALETTIMGLALAHQHNRGGHARATGLAGRSCEEGPGAFHHTRLIVHRVLT